jgi:hypothetical protein
MPIFCMIRPEAGFAGHVGGVNAVQPQDLEPIRHHGTRRFRAIAMVPVRDPKPVTEFGVAMGRVEAQSDAAHEGVVCP